MVAGLPILPKSVCMQPALDISACDREPIHIPGAVQPHGVLLVVDATGRIEQAGGPTDDLLGIPATDLIGRNLGDVAADAPDLAEAEVEPLYLGILTPHGRAELDAVAHRVAGRIVIELEPAPARRASAAQVARIVEHAGATFAGAATIDDLAGRAAKAFSDATGYDRVMVYRFLADETGVVIAEVKAGNLSPFLNHRYPASDIPRQARALYLRNLIRAIPDVAYEAAGMVVGADDPPLDMSRCDLRSVSPVHIQYLKNMGVGASASMSIVRDGALWGLVACHNSSARHLSFDDRTLCRLLVSSLSNHVARIQDAALYEARLRARTAEDDLMRVLGDGLGDTLADHVADLLTVVPASGVALRQGSTFSVAGHTPETGEIARLADWLLEREGEASFASSALGEEYAPARDFAATASGVLAVTLSLNPPEQVLWFRPEQIELVNWAGNPHKAVEPNALGMLTPRKSFDVWQETVRGRAEPWSIVDVETANRLTRGLSALERAQGLNRLNESLRRALGERDSLLTQKDHLLREGNHRIQNSLQIVGSMLTMQMRETADSAVKSQLEEALGRVNAVALVHRRLYRANQPRTVDFDTYARELLDDVGKSLGGDWKRNIALRTSPVLAPTELAMSLGLVITELVMNSVKYAYGGVAGPIEVDVAERNGNLIVKVRDRGKWEANAPTKGGGFGSRLIDGLVEGSRGTLTRTQGDPGLVVTLSAPLAAP